jgi:Family of unknown function (DUF6496)
MASALVHALTEDSMAKYGKKAGKKVERAMHERKRGTLKSGSGRKVTSRKQAIAIGLSEAREAGAKVPERDSASRKSSGRKSTARKGTARKSTAGRSTAGRSTGRKSTARKSTARQRTGTRKTAKKR